MNKRLKQYLKEDLNSERFETIVQNSDGNGTNFEYLQTNGAWGKSPVPFKPNEIGNIIIKKNRNGHLAERATVEVSVSHIATSKGEHETLSFRVSVDRD